MRCAHLLHGIDDIVEVAARCGLITCNRGGYSLGRLRFATFGNGALDKHGAGFSFIDIVFAATIKLAANPSVVAGVGFVDVITPGNVQRRDARLCYTIVARTSVLGTGGCVCTVASDACFPSAIATECIGRRYVAKDCRKDLQPVVDLRKRGPVRGLGRPAPQACPFIILSKGVISPNDVSNIFYKLHVQNTPRD